MVVVVGAQRMVGPEAGVVVVVDIDMTLPLRCLWGRTASPSGWEETGRQQQHMPRGRRVTIQSSRPLRLRGVGAGVAIQPQEGMEDLVGVLVVLRP